MPWLTASNCYKLLIDTVRNKVCVRGSCGRVYLYMEHIRSSRALWTLSMGADSLVRPRITPQALRSFLSLEYFNTLFTFYQLQHATYNRVDFIFYYWSNEIINREKKAVFQSCYVFQVKESRYIYNISYNYIDTLIGFTFKSK